MGRLAYVSDLNPNNYPDGEDWDLTDKLVITYLIQSQSKFVGNFVSDPVIYKSWTNEFQQSLSLSYGFNALKNPLTWHLGGWLNSNAEFIPVFGYAEHDTVAASLCGTVRAAENSGWIRLSPNWTIASVIQPTECQLRKLVDWSLVGDDSHYRNEALQHYLKEQNI